MREIQVSQISDSAVTEILTNPVITGTPVEDIYVITDGPSVSIDPANGSTQLWTLGANRTPNLSLITTGKAVRLGILDGTGYTLTLTSVEWMNNGGVAPTLSTSHFTWILLENVGDGIYGWVLGDVL